ncbi:MAG: hypothetical protein ACFFEE_00435 [Candidatus Thorarchaeota archaeon]
MSEDKKRAKNIKDVTSTGLLDEFAEPNPIIEKTSRYDMTDEEYIEMMVRKESERKLWRMRMDKERMNE